jgi:hypothetical protein
MDAGPRSRALRVIIHGHLWLACGAAAQTWFVQDLMDRSGWRAPLLGALAAFTGYTFMRLARTGPAAGTGEQHLAWAAANRRPLMGAMVLCALVALAVAAPQLWALWRMAWPLALVVALYAVPVSMTGGRALGLRWVPLLKAFVIAGAWAWTTVGLPGVFADGDTPRGGRAWLFTMQMAFFLAIALVFDLRDSERDKGDVRTLPQLLGGRITRVIAMLLMLYPAAVFALLAYIGRSMSALEGNPAWPWEMVLALLGYVLGAVLIARSATLRGPLDHGLVVDGLLVLVPLLYASGLRL